MKLFLRKCELKLNVHIFFFGLVLSKLTCTLKLNEEGRRAPLQAWMVVSERLCVCERVYWGGPAVHHSLANGTLHSWRVLSSISSIKAPSSLHPQRILGRRWHLSTPARLKSFLCLRRALPLVLDLGLGRDDVVAEGIKGKWVVWMGCPQV